MRILSVANHFPPGYTGGAEIVNLYSGLGLLERGLHYSVLTLNNRDVRGLDDAYLWQGLRVRRVQAPPPGRRTAVNDLFDGRLYRAALREMKRAAPDLVHIHNVSGATMAPFVAARRLGLPVVATLHDLWLLCPNNMRYQSDGSFCDPRRYPDGCGKCARRFDYWADVPRRRAVMQALTASVRRFISPSQALIERHVEAGYDRARFRVARHGFPIALPHEHRHPGVRALLAEPSARPTILFAGGGVEIKGAAVVAEMIPLLLRALPDARLVVAGGGDPALLERMRGFGAAVALLGPVPYQEMLTLFALSDLTLVPSVWHENLPVVISESYQVGTPVVGSAIGGIPELIEPGETGYLFPTGDAAALAERIVHHFARPAAERRRMRLRCVAKIRGELTMEQFLDRLQSIYAEALAD